jgi:hypothetical protein
MSEPIPIEFRTTTSSNVWSPVPAAPLSRARMQKDGHASATLSLFPSNTSDLTVTV